MRIFRVFALFVAGVAFAQQQPNQLPLAPSASKAAATQADPTKPDYSKDPWVVEYQKTTYRFDNDGTGSREVQARIRVQNEGAVDALGNLVLGYSAANEQIEIKYVRVRKADGSVVTAGDSAVQDLTAPVARENPMYTDFRQKHITVPGLRPGETLEYDFIVKTVKALTPGQFFMDYDFMDRGIVLDEELEINVPKSRVVKLKTGSGFDAKESVEGDRKIYAFKSSHLKNDDDDDKDNTKKARKPKDKFPDVQLTTFSSWDDVGRWYQGLMKDRTEVTPELKARADELTKNATTDIDKIHALYDYVARNYRYVSLSFGLGRYQPHTAAEVFTNLYGDCKDKHTLLAALLKAEGFEADAALMNSSRKIDPDVPSPSQFDHVITMVPLNGQQLWMDTTTEIAPFRLIMYQLRDKKALLVPTTATPALLTTPAEPPMPNSQLTEVDGKISELGKLTAKVNLTFSGDAELPLRAAFRQTPANRWKDLAKVIAYMQGLRGNASDVQADDPAKSMGPYHVSYTVEVPNFLEWSKRDSQVQLPMTPLRMPESTDNDANSPDPFEIGAPGTVTYKLKLELPKDYTARAPLPFSMTRDYADYKATYTLDGNVLTAVRTADLKKKELPATRLDDYAAFRRAVMADERQTLAIETTVAGTGDAPKPPEGVKPDELYDAAVSAYQSQNFTAAIALFKRVTELDPKHKGVWNDLGSAYLAVRDHKDAIEALNKAIEQNPYDENAYNNLGRVYWDTRDYDKAAAAFKKQLEVNPLDQYAHRNLGSMLLEEKKFAEALPELEKTVQLAPDDALSYVSLGTAQLELGQSEKALASFDRAVNISPSPVVWNNIAYQLSLKNVHLDLAQRYAESAVAATAATLRNLGGDRQDLQQQALVVSLGAYWDTLGWVYFQRGDLDKAQSYVEAAWVLGQHGEVGDHLAQIYEKRGEKAKALHQYALAEVAYKPDPETRERLVKLAGSEKAADALLEPARQELASMSLISLGPMKNATEPLKADFYVVISPGPKVDDVRFISGSDKLKEFSDALRTANFSLPFPDSTPTRLLRKGTLSCDKECTFKLEPADDVTGGM